MTVCTTNYWAYIHHKQHFPYYLLLSACTWVWPRWVHSPHWSESDDSRGFELHNMSESWQ